MKKPASSSVRQAGASRRGPYPAGDGAGVEDSPDEGAAGNSSPACEYEVSVIVISFNTRDLLRECLQTAVAECMRLPEDLRAEVLVVDNGSSDGSAEVVATEFASSRIPVRLFRSEVNLGLAEASNLAMEAAGGRYIVLLNYDAFLQAGALRKAILHMDANRAVGIGGGRLVGRDGAWRPSAQSFPTLWRDALFMTGLSERFPGSRIFNLDRTGASPDQPAQVDWVPQAFCILRREILKKAGLFDPAFFLFYKEVDLCRRVKAAGFRVQYWPDMVVTYIGDESGLQFHALKCSDAGAELVLGRIRSTLLYYRKHHGRQARLALWLEQTIYTLRRLRNQGGVDAARRERAEEAKLLLGLMRRAWKETEGGRVSPPRPR
ncbi:MAG: glycosyltransferase family 2 protein [Terracidiphilus sp.]|jgi:GT2 family glycosyltransferase